MFPQATLFHIAQAVLFIWQGGVRRDEANFQAVSVVCIYADESRLWPGGTPTATMLQTIGEFGNVAILPEDQPAVTAASTKVMEAIGKEEHRRALLNIVRKSFWRSRAERETWNGR